MRFIADFHIHSHYSIATSKKLIPEYLDYWARIKGINVIGTGDCFHPGWVNELKEKLEVAPSGLYRLKKGYQLNDLTLPYHGDSHDDVLFILTGELSSIYKKNGKVRKVHNLCVFPDFEALEGIQGRLKAIGNIDSDGRPILGLDSKDLLEMVLESSEYSYLIPAHIWTPWFSVLGSKSGFDSVKECYEELTPNIFAVETGLSSDPPMNWACSFLDDFSLISNSDAHSPGKLGREANLFDTNMTYHAILEALKVGEGFLGTVEFFPQEGKYHYDGHRKCNICWDPLETLKQNGICPVCKKAVTMGVMHRVAELADRTDLSEASNRKDFYSITSLPDLFAEILGMKSSSSKTVTREYFRVIEKLGSEFYILLFAENDEIKESGGELLAEGVRRLRSGEVIIDEGYDGEFGRIKAFDKGELSSFSGASLFSFPKAYNIPRGSESRDSIKFNIKEFQVLYNKFEDRSDEEPIDHGILTPSAEQKEGIEHFEGPCMVLAGPGSGKTRILTERIIYLVNHRNIRPENILSITFSNKAAEEMRKRVQKILYPIQCNISTFHAFGLSVLKEYCDIFKRDNNFYISDDWEKREIIKKISGVSNRGINKMLNEIDFFKQGTISEVYSSGNDIDISTMRSHGSELMAVSDLIESYEGELQKRNAFDLNDLIYLPVQLFSTLPEILSKYREKYPWILIDEFQDINARQYELIMLLSSMNDPNLFVIGDPDQSIYGFRGSDVRFIDRLKSDFPLMKLIHLKESYRCPMTILRAATQILQRQDYLQGKSENIKVHIQETETEKSEADWIAAKIENMMGGVRAFSIDSNISDGNAINDAESFSDFCVLCRTSVLFDPIIKAFEDHGIAYQVIGTEPFYREEPFSSLLNLFRRIYYLFMNKKSHLEPFYHEVVKMIDGSEEISSILRVLMNGIDVTEENRKRIEQFADFYGHDYKKFFINISTRQGVDDYDIRAESVSIMTLHASKGLEFNAVFIPGCERGIIPFELFGRKSQSEREEEERLFYVGITRTKKYLFLSNSRRRFFKGRVLCSERSPFLNRLEKEIVHFERRKNKESANPEEIQLDLF